MRRIIQAFCNSRAGLMHAMRTETAVRQEIILLIIAVPLAIFIGADVWKRAALVAIVLAVIAVELLNTCLEKLCDHVTPELHPKIKIVKDMGSAAVLFTLVAGGLVWLAAVLEKMGLA